MYKILNVRNIYDLQYLRILTNWALQLNIPRLLLKEHCIKEVSKFEKELVINDYCTLAEEVLCYETVCKEKRCGRLLI